MPTDYLPSARAFLPKALMQETEYSDTYDEYSSQHKKNNVTMDAGQDKNFQSSNLFRSCLSLFETNPDKAKI